MALPKQYKKDVAAMKKSKLGEVVTVEVKHGGKVHSRFEILLGDAKGKESKAQLKQDLGDIGDMLLFKLEETYGRVVEVGE